MRKQYISNGPGGLQDDNSPMAWVVFSIRFQIQFEKELCPLQSSDI